MKTKCLVILLSILFTSAACSQPTPEPTPIPAATPTQAVEPSPTDKPALTEEPVPTETPPPAATLEPTEAAFEWPAPLLPEEAFTRAEVTSEEQATFDLLAAQNYAANDPIALAVSIEGKPQPESPPDAPPELREGTVQSFWIHNTDTNEWSQIDARLERISEHAYFWFDTSRELSDPASVDRAVETFEGFYQTVRDVYGEELSPGIDGDPRIYVLHPSALALCNVTEDTAHQCGILGYFSTTDTLPVEIDEHSNEHELFVMNIDRAIGGDVYASTLAHEFRHMIEHNYDRHDDDWEVEGTAVLAQTLIGDIFDPLARANLYLADPDLQMNAWTQGNTIPHYGKGYIFSQYILDRFGLDFYAAWVQHPDRAFFAINDVLTRFGQTLTAHDLWLDFGATIALLGFENAPPEYAFADGTFPEGFSPDPPGKSPINKFPSETEGEVSQYGFDIYDIRGSAPVQLDFTGATKVAIMENTVPASGQYMWWSGRANQSSMTLTGEFDLTDVDAATLEYAVNYSFEKGYDFGYVLISTDGGQTWQGLTSENMQGDDPSDNPGDAALTDRFYTGRVQDWANESIDLTPYAGQPVMIRFQYITDAIFTAPGMTIDNVAVPEIGFYDDTETEVAGWVYDGFVRVTAYEPQQFALALITFDAAGVPTVEKITPAEDNTVSFDVPLGADSGRALLVVTATNPLLLTPASYLIAASQ